MLKEDEDLIRRIIDRLLINQSSSNANWNIQYIVILYYTNKIIIYCMRNAIQLAASSIIIFS